MRNVQDDEQDMKWFSDSISLLEIYSNSEGVFVGLMCVCLYCCTNGGISVNQNHLHPLHSCHAKILLQEKSTLSTSITSSDLPSEYQSCVSNILLTVFFSTSSLSRISCRLYSTQQTRFPTKSVQPSSKAFILGRVVREVRADSLKRAMPHQNRYHSSK